MALLPKCFLDGSSTPVPHVCLLESVYDVARLGTFERYVPLTRGPSSTRRRTSRPPASGRSTSGAT